MGGEVTAMQREQIESNTSQRSLVQVYTGEGKGKTTAALGLALRAVGHGLKVIMIQFVKRDLNWGEHLFIDKYHPFEIVQLNQGDMLYQTKEELRSLARQTLACAEEVLFEGHHHVVILDEIFTAIDAGLLEISDVTNLIDMKPHWVELVLTGQRAPREIQKRADLVTEMLMIKHPFADGIRPREGIDY